MRIPFIFLVTWLAVAAPNGLHAGLKWTVTERNLTGEPTHAEIETTFPFINEGKEPVTIKTMTTSCGCTAAELKKKTYAPGEGGKVEVLVHYTGDVPVITTSVIIVTDEPAAVSQELAIRIAVPIVVRKERVEISPQFVYWRQGDKPVPQVVGLRVMNPDDAIRPVKVTTADAGFRLELRAPRFDDPFLYELVITPLNVDQPRQAEIKVVTNWLSPDLPPGSQPLYYRLTAAIK